MQLEVAIALITAVSSAAVAVGSALLTRRTERSVVELQDELETQRQEQLVRHQAVVDEGAKRKERIREEVLRWANPVLGAVEGLERPLGRSSLVEDVTPGTKRWARLSLIHGELREFGGGMPEAPSARPSKRLSLSKPATVARRSRRVRKNGGAAPSRDQE